MNLAAFVLELKPFMLLLLQPPVPLLALIVIGTGLMRQHRVIGRLVLSLGLIGVWLSCTEGAAQWLTHQLVKTPPALSGERMRALQSQAKERGNVGVLVLGASARAFVPEYEGPGLKPLSLERLRYGIWLGRRLQAPVGYAGGGGWDRDHPEASEAALAEQVARDEYRHPLKWAEARSRDTQQNAAMSLALLEPDGIKALVLVTNDMHMPRARAAFEAAAQGRVEIIPAPVSLRRDATSEWSDWCPSNEGFARVRYAVYEWLGRQAGH